MSDGFTAAASPAVEERRREILDFVREGASRGEAFPDLSKLEREEVCAMLEILIEYFRGRLLAKLGDPVSEDEYIDRIERTALAKERIRQNTNIRLTLADLWISFISQPLSTT